MAFYKMSKCRGVTKSGKKCKAYIIAGEYCRWHTIKNTTECVVCLEPIEEPMLSCGHWIHRECVQKHADAMQDIRAQEGYPPLTEGLCSICRAPVSDIIPKPAPTVSPPEIVTIVLTREEMCTAYYAWSESTRHVPLVYYIINQLSEKYPNYSCANILLFAQFFTDLVHGGHLNLMLQRPQNFSRAE